MSREQQRDDLVEAFTDFAAEYPQTALETIVGLMVALIEVSIAREGGDTSQRIVIESGDGQRTITIHELAASKGDKP